MSEDKMTNGQDVYTTNKTDDYLTMARIMEKEMNEWRKKNMTPMDAGATIVKAKRAYQDGFMAGFCFRFTEEE